MRNFEKWLAESELAKVPLTEHERLILKIAYLAGALAANAENMQALSRITQSLSTTPH